MVATLLLRLGPGGSPSHNRCDGRQHTSPQPQEAAKAASEVYLTVTMPVTVDL